jgi:hypothetical protein
MFELLLQADKSMSDGLLDQAERTYWQLIELDPTNAIAVACVARISLKRGDGRLARTFADRAIGIDPDSIVARKVIHALEEGAALPEDSSTPDINLRGAERLEALSRRRRSRLGGDEGGEGAKSSGRARTSGRGNPAKPAAAAPAPTPGSVKPVRGRTQPDQLEPLPAEPLRERRETGRLAAAAAAAAAAAREPTHTRREPHHAMPTGRRMFEPRPVNSAPDPFAAAEMAAAVAAVDEMDEPYESEPSAELAVEVEMQVEATAEGVADTAAEVAAEHAARGEANAEAAAEVQAAADAEDAAEIEAAAEAEAEPGADAAVSAEPAPDALDAAHVMEAVDATGVGESVALRLAFLSSPIPEAPAEPEAEAAEPEPTAKPWPEVADRELAAAGFPEPDTDQAEMSEEIAETQALREAMAMVLPAQNVDDTAGEPRAGLEDPAATPDPAETEPQTHSAEAPPDASAPEEAPADHDSAPRKKGLFRRFRG